MAADGPDLGRRELDGRELDGPEAVLAALDPEQREVALVTRGPVCVIAGAGTGKTRAIAHRIAYGVRTGAVKPGHVLAVTFTSRAAGELRARLRQLTSASAGADDGPAGGVTARTFHAAALRQLVHFWPATVGGAPPSVVASKIPLLSEAARVAGVRVSGPDLRDVAAEVEWSKVMQVRPGDYVTAAAAARRAPPVRAETVVALYGAYEQLRRERHLIDFESVLELTAAILTDDQRAGDTVRDRYRYFVVDEFQDVNPLQKLLLDAWLGGRDDLCVVGDPAQAIYSFTGATPAYLTGFRSQFPDATVLRLVRNYRSTPPVLTLANRLTAAMAQELALVRTDPRGVSPAGAPVPPGSPPEVPALVAQCDGGPAPEFREYEDEETEAAAVAARVQRLIRDGTAPRDIAVLLRINAHTERFERAFAQVGVPCQVRGAERFFDRPEVRQAIGLLRAAAKVVSAEAPATSRPAGSPAEVPAAGRWTGVAGADAAIDARQILTGLGLTREPPAGRGAARDRWESLAALAQLAEDMCAAAPGIGLAGVTAELTRRAAIEHAPELDSVTIASLHSAKGLEWEAVFLPGLTEGNLPIIHADTADGIAEELRLLYVGLTRARRRLMLSWALARSPGARHTRSPSRFIEVLRSTRGRHRARLLTAGVPGGRGAGPGRGSAGAAGPGGYGGAVPAARTQRPAEEGRVWR